MLNSLASPTRKIDVFAGFGPVVRLVLKYWKDRIVEFQDRGHTQKVIRELRQRLRTENVVIFFDHHYAFDGLPAMLALGDIGELSEQVSGAIVPYASFLDMGVDNRGRFSLKYWLRTFGFQRLRHNIRKANPTVQFYPVTREFELENPQLCEIAERMHPNTNVKYLKAFVNLFTRNRKGQVCLLAPMAGLAFPEKPVLHPSTYRSIEIVQNRSKRELSFYFIGAYPRLNAYYDYLAPLFLKHKFVLSGPFQLPVGDYQEAYDIVSLNLSALRQSGHFMPPDYSKISAK
jgi:hypothetical protein